ncbi:MAG: LysR family transcriptional regulator [Reyranellaceae bacterium]
MTGLRRMLPSSNALFVFESAARNANFTRAAAELNVTQPAVSRMLSRLERHVGLPLFERDARGVALTADGEALYRHVAEGFRSIEAGLRSLEQRRSGLETVTLSVSSAFTTHWLMPRIDRFQQLFPKVDLRFQLIAGSLRGPVEDVDLGMRFVGKDDVGPQGVPLMNELMLPVCSPGYSRRRIRAAGQRGAGERGDGNTVIHLTDSPTGWTDGYAAFDTGRRGPTKSIAFSDYAVVVQAALLGQGIAFGWLTVVSNALIAGTLVPAAARVTQGPRVCVLTGPANRAARPVVREVRDWLIAEMRRDVEKVDRLHPGLQLRRLAL